MKYDSREDYGNGKKYYRKCVLIDRNTFEITDGPDDMIVDEDTISKDKFICDFKMAPIVSALNKKGYETMFCCEGHIDLEVNDKGNNCFSNPFVMFKAGKNFNRYCTYLANLPRQFDVRIDNRSFENLEDELGKTYEKEQVIDPAEKRISIYTTCYYAYEEDGEFFECNPDILDTETFNKYNDIDLGELAKWVDTLPDLTSFE